MTEEATLDQDRQELGTVLVATLGEAVRYLFLCDYSRRQENPAADLGSASQAISTAL